MLKVECPSCDAPYELDPARLPEAGMRMRCPSCAAIFRVGRGGILGDAAAPPPRRAAPETEIAPPMAMMGASSPSPKPPAPPVKTAAGLPPPARRPAGPKPTEAMKGAPPPPPAPKLPRARATTVAMDELDLPEPSRRIAQGKDSLDDFGLMLSSESARGPRDSLEVSAPLQKALIAQKPETTIGAELDLEFGDLDLPAPSKRYAPKDSLDGFDFGPPPPAVQGAAIDDSLDLPAPSARTARDLADFSDLGLELDLPEVKPADSLDDLPIPRKLGSAASLDDLPMPSGGAQPRGSLDDLPSPVRPGIATEIGSFDLPIPAGIFHAADGRLQEASLEEILGTSSAREGTSTADFLSLGLADDPVAYGALDLGETALGQEGQESQESQEGAEASLDSLAFDGDLELEDIGRPAPTSTNAGEEPRARASRGPLIVFLVLLMIAGAGAALGLTPHGFFGRYYLEQFLPDAGSDALTEATLRSAELNAADDRYESVRASLRELSGARREHGLNRLLLTRSVVHEVLFQRRFGEDAASSERIARIMGRLEERKFVAPQMDLALAADALARGDRDTAEAAIERARESGPGDPYVDLIAAELALSRGALMPALAAFERAEAKDGGARAIYGKARLLFAEAEGAGRSDDAQERALASLDRVLAVSRRHVSARVDKAALLLFGSTAEDREKRDEARRLAREAASLEPFEGALLGGSRFEQARAFAILGIIEEKNGARREALEAFERAYQLDPSAAVPVYGSGRVLLRDNRAKDALIRFETAARSAKPDELYDGRPIALEAQLDAVSAELSLGASEDARDRAAALVQHYPEDPRVLLRAGEAMASVGAHTEAEQHFRAAIEKSPESFHAYMGLAQLLFASDRADEAADVLREAEGKVEMTAEVRRLRGQAEIKRLQPARALDEFDRAIKLEAGDHGAIFGRAVALRMLGRLDEAEGVFDQLAEIDAAYPGLAIERGRLFEAKGLRERAVEEYRAALEERGDDPELLLRAGAAELSSGSLEVAERHLKRASESLPNHPELIHYLGRVALLKGDLPDALDKLSRAVAMEREHGGFRTEYAKALIAAGDLAGARREVVGAIEADPSLADAYWLRGRIALRTGSPRDAIDDLEKALRLMPTRDEALSDLGEAFEQLNRTSYAISAFERAAQLAPGEGRYAYRLGRLYIENNQLRPAEQSLIQAIATVEASSDGALWLPDAHRLLGDTYRVLRNRRLAKESYERFLQLAPPDSIDREEIERRMTEL